MRPFLLVLPLLLCTVPRAACAEPPAEAKPVTAEAKAQAQRFFQAGVSLQKTEDFEAAIAAYETSLQLFATKSALFNLANCQRAAHRYADAWNSLHRLQTEFGPELVEPMSSTSLAQLEELENLTGLLTVETHPTGASIDIDGKPLGTAPWAAPLRVTIGHHVVQASLAGYVSKDNTVQISPKQSLALVIELDPATAEPIQPEAPATATETTPGLQANPSPAPVPSAEPSLDARPSTGPSPGWRTAGWAGIALGAVGVAVGARAGLLALDVDERLGGVCEAGHCAQSSSSDVDRLERLSMSANLFIGAGAVLIATGATLVLWPSSPDAPEQVSLTLSPSAFRIGGTF